MRIVFAHNVYNRFQTLQETIKFEKEYFPDSYSVIAYNNESPKDYLNFPNIELVKFTGLTHKIGCANGCIAAIQESFKYDPDFVIFSHDDVSIMNPKIVRENLLLLKSGYDAICRKPIPSELYGDNYYLMEVFYMTRDAAEKSFSGLTFFENEGYIPRDIRSSISPEVFVYNTINRNGLKVFEKKYKHQDQGYNHTLIQLMGFTHKNAGERGWTD